MKITEDIKPFIKPREQMTREDYQLLGNYIIKRKIEKIKGWFKHEKL